MSVGVDESTYPGVEPAFTFVQPSYQLLVSRFEASDTRLTALLTLIVTVTLGVPLFARNVNPLVDFHSRWFWAGLTFFSVAAISGVFGRITGAVTLVNPSVLYDESLHKTDWEFKKDAVYRAGRHFEKNSKAIARKGVFALVVTGALLAEVAMFAVWLAQ